jgi:hypothetical protein
VSLDGHKYQTLIEYGFEWYLVYRTKEEMQDLAKGVIGNSRVRVDEIEKGIMKFLEIQT